MQKNNITYNTEQYYTMMKTNPEVITMFNQLKGKNGGKKRRTKRRRSTKKKKTLYKKRRHTNKRR
jgi:hypothetical protein